MKKIILILSFFISGFCNAQAIYKGLEYGMTEKEAKKEFKKNKDDYKTVDLGNGFLYRIYRQNFTFEDGKLVGILLSPKGSAMGQTYDAAVSYLDYTRSFFEQQNYTVFSDAEYWNAPYNFRSKYGLLMINPENNLMVQLYPIKYKGLGGTTFMVKLQLYNKDHFMKWYNAAAEQQQKKAKNSGF